MPRMTRLSSRFNLSQFLAIAPHSLGGWIGAGVALSALVWASPATATSISAWQFDPATQQFTITLPSGVTPTYAVTAEGDRIFLDLPQTQLGNVLTAGEYEGAVRQVQLTQLDATTVRVTLTVDPALGLTAAQVQLVAMATGEQTRWVLTPNLDSATTATPTPPVTANGMIVELPVLPADPNLSWPYTGVGRLSISAANLMLSSNLDTFNTLPETLAIDPFNLGLPEVEQVSVPSLDELDAAVGVAIAPSIPTPAVDPATLEPPATATATATTTFPSEVSSSGAITGPPPSNQPGTNAVATAPVTPPASPDPQSVTLVSSVQAPQPQVPIDQDNGGLAIPVIPSAPEAAVPGPTVPAPAVPEPGPTPVAIEVAPGVSPPPTAGTIVQTPPLTQAPPVAAIAPATTPSFEPPFLAVEPPASGSPSVSATSGLAVPTLPNTVATGTVVPPSITVEPDPVFLAADSPIAFGQPLPTGSKAIDAAPLPGTGDRPLSPDILIASGTVLELRYTGTQPLTLNPNTNLNEVLVLETEIRDPVTHGVLAPAGSQLIGQFESTNESQQWVSQMLIAPGGQRVPFASTSEYIDGTPQLSGGGLALGTGLGALALTLLTGFSGIGLIGGALIGATTAVGTAPQYIVIQPNQVIYAQVTQDIPRSIPIATVPADVREWGTIPNSW
jgi:hypothetical protein